MISWLLIRVINRQRSSSGKEEGRSYFLQLPRASSWRPPSFSPSQRNWKVLTDHTWMAYLRSCASARQGRSEALDSSQLPHLATPEPKRPSPRPRLSVCSWKPRFETSHSWGPAPLHAAPPLCTQPHPQTLPAHDTCLIPAWHLIFFFNRRKSLYFSFQILKVIWLLKILWKIQKDVHKIKTCSLKRNTKTVLAYIFAISLQWTDR